MSQVRHPTVLSLLPDPQWRLLNTLHAGTARWQNAYRVMRAANVDAEGVTALVDSWRVELQMPGDGDPPRTGDGVLNLPWRQVAMALTETGRSWAEDHPANVVLRRLLDAGGPVVLTELHRLADPDLVKALGERRLVTFQLADLGSWAKVQDPSVFDPTDVHALLAAPGQQALGAT